MHGNNKSDEELRAAAGAGALVALDALDEPARAAEAGVRRVLVRVMPGVEAETHEAIRTGHRGSKFGLDAGRRIVADRRRPRGRAGGRRAARSRRISARPTAAPTWRRWLSSAISPHAAATSSAGRPRSSTSAAGSGSAMSRTSPSRRSRSSCARSQVQLRNEWEARGTPGTRGSSSSPAARSLSVPAAFTIYRVGAVKQAGDTRYVAIDGGMSDNPRPQLYGARYSAVLANRVARGPCGRVLHDRGKALRVRRPRLIEQVALPEPSRGDLLVVPGHRRLHPRDGLELQRCAATGRRPRF